MPQMPGASCPGTASDGITRASMIVLSAIARTQLGTLPSPARVWGVAIALATGYWTLVQSNKCGDFWTIY